MNTRELTGEDAEAYYELRLEALLTNPDAFITTYEQEKQKPNPIQTTSERLNSDLSRTFGLFSEGKLRGIATLMRQTHPKFSHKGEILAMYITPSIRRKGGAAQLFSEIIKSARDLELEQLLLSVVTENEPAKALYQKVGFQSYGLEQRAIKLTERYLDEEHMVMFLKD